jgi:hypothetical protein
VFAELVSVACWLAACELALGGVENAAATLVLPDRTCLAQSHPLACRWRVICRRARFASQIAKPIRGLALDSNDHDSHAWSPICPAIIGDYGRFGLPGPEQAPSQAQRDDPGQSTAKRDIQ